ncbi:MAG: DUF6538 domain-containing protein [Hyphomicrobiales bacterium]
MKVLEKVSGHTRLYRRGAVYYHRAAVPVDIAETYGKREETFSLKTKDHPEALQKVRIAAVEVDAKFEAHRRHIASSSGPKIDKLTRDQLDAIKAVYYHHLLDEDDDTRDDRFEQPVQDGDTQSSPKLFRRKTFNEYQALNAELSEHHRGDMAQGEDSTGFFQGEAEEVLTWESIGLRLKGSSTSWPRLIRTLQEASIEASEAIAKRNEGQIVPPPEDPNKANTKPLSAPLLSSIFDSWLMEKKASGEWKLKAENDYRHWIEAFITICGDKPFTNYEKADARNFKSHAMILPSNWRKHQATRNASILEAPALGKAAGLSTISLTTLNKATGRLNYFWKWVEAHYDDVTPNLFQGLKVTTKTKGADERNPFSAEQLSTIFSSPLFVGCKSIQQRHQTGTVNMSRTAYYWLPILSLFTGARLANGGRGDVLDALQGHSASGMRGRYGTGDKTEVYPSSTLQKTIECVTYPSVDFGLIKCFGEDGN